MDTNPLVQALLKHANAKPPKDPSAEVSAHHFVTSLFTINSEDWEERKTRKCITTHRTVPVDNRYPLRSHTLSRYSAEIPPLLRKPIHSKTPNTSY